MNKQEKITVKYMVHDKATGYKKGTVEVSGRFGSDNFHKEAMEQILNKHPHHFVDGYSEDKK